MAAGFAIRGAMVDDFRRGVSRAIDAQGEVLEPELRIDGYLPWSELSLELVADLERLAPFGPGNPALLLVSKGLMLNGYHAIGREQQHLLLRVEDENKLERRVMWWNGAEELQVSVQPEGVFDLAYKVRASTFRGERDVQVEWVDFRINEEVIDLRSTTIEVQDYRHETHPLPILERLAALDDVQVWCEAGAEQRLPDLRSPVGNRFSLSSSKALIIWTTPPGRKVLEGVLKHVKPERVFLFGVDPGLDRWDAFIRRLAGLTKYAIKSRQGQVSLTELAGAMAHRQVTVQEGLRWLTAKGHVQIVVQDDHDIVVGEGTHQISPLAEQVEERLRILIEETAAYRAYFRRAAADDLLSI
jgi:single-stranded-DNA-specific exonuclease